MRPLAVCLWILVVTSASPALGPDSWMTPRALKPGDTIAVIAPAAPATEPEFPAYVKLMEGKGYKVISKPGLVGRKDHYLGGTDDERAGEINDYLRDPSVRMSMPVRGGFGVSRILDRIDYEALRRDPKIIAGYSDLTALHLAAARHARVVTFHSPMAMRDLWRENEPGYAFPAKSFRRAVFADQYLPDQRGYVVGVPERHWHTTVVGGKATGRLLGGNLSLVVTLMGTPHALEPKGAILFLEDVSEPAYRIDRYLSQLRLGGVLDQVAGVVLGTFTTKDEKEEKDTDRVLKDYFGKLKVPVVMDYPVGHTPRNATLPHGAMVELDADRGSLKVLENPVRVE
ncbi:MAG: LD-carboxypeptidase [Gemmataceae bacterium]